MNRSKVKKLHAILAERNPDADVAVLPQQDGVNVVISGSDFGAGASGPHVGTDVRLCMSDDGPLMRFLVNGRL
jgi:hypothetical protein